MANVRYFLDLGEIEGESTVEGHEGEIELLSFSWGLHGAPMQPMGGGGATGKVQVDGLTAFAESSVASPRLLAACASGKHLPTAVLTGWRDDEAGERRQDFLVVTMSDVTISSFRMEAGTGEQSEDELVLSFARFELAVESGDGGRIEKAGWDVLRARPV